MSEKRRDNRNRILHEGVYQRAAGKYRYRYIDENGQENNVYSWHLAKNDLIRKTLSGLNWHRSLQMILLPVMPSPRSSSVTSSTL